MPTHQPLFYDDIYIDIETGSRCHTSNEETIEAEEVIIDKEKYYFTKDDTIHVYKFDKALNAYKELDESSTEYENVYKIINNSKI
jgi:hypothetical protein